MKSGQPWIMIVIHDTRRALMAAKPVLAQALARRSTQYNRRSTTVEERRFQRRVKRGE